MPIGTPLLMDKHLWYLLFNITRHQFCFQVNHWATGGSRRIQGNRSSNSYLQQIHTLFFPGSLILQADIHHLKSVSPPYLSGWKKFLHREVQIPTPGMYHHAVMHVLFLWHLTLIFLMSLRRKTQDKVAEPGQKQTMPLSIPNYLHCTYPSKLAINAEATSGNDGGLKGWPNKQQ